MEIVSTLTTGLGRAQDIMGDNFFGVEQATGCSRYQPSDRQRAFFSEVSFPESVLEESSKTHLLVAVSPSLVREICNVAKDRSLLDISFFPREIEKESWELVSRDILLGSTSKGWIQQIPLIGKKHNAPRADLLIYAVLGHHLATGERLLPSVYARTASVSCGQHVLVGDFGKKGIEIIYEFPDQFVDENVGICTQRKHDCRTVRL